MTTNARTANQNGAKEDSSTKGSCMLLLLHFVKPKKLDSQKGDC